MKFKRTLGTMLVLLAILPGLTGNFTPQVKAESSGGVRQGVLLLMTSTCAPYSLYKFPALVAQKLGLPYDIVEVDTTTITNSTFYDADGNGKYIMIFIVSPAPNHIDSIEWSYIDAYEQTFNVSEASLYVYNFPSTVWSRYGISAVGSSILVENVTFTGTNNIRLEMLKPTGENGTKIVDVTLFSNVTIYAKAGNNTMDYPFLWAYKGTDNVWRTASSHFDTAPLWLKYWSWMPAVLALKLSPNNILFNTYIAYDIDDLNSEGFGRNINATEAQEMVEFYDNYSMPFQLATMNAEEQWWYSEYDSFWDVVRNNPEVFDVYYHATLDTVWYKRLDEAWTFLNSKNLDEVPLFYGYIPPGRHWINSTVVQYDYENFGVRFFAQDTSQYYPSQYYPSYTNAWLLVRYGFGTDNSTFENLWLGNLDYGNYAQWLRYHIETVKSSLLYTGYIVFWGHYPGFVNDQPMLKVLRDVAFEVGIYKTVGVRTYEIAFMSRTMGEKGSYNITSPVYHPDTQQLQFSLTSKGTAPDDICGIIVPTNTAKMNDAIAVLSDNDSTFFLFKYEAEKTYTIYLNQQQPEPYITLFQGWLSNTSYSNNKLTFTVSAPSRTTSTTKVYCGDKSEPTAVYATNGTLSWSYNASTMTLTLNVTHVGSAEIVVNWRLVGDVDGDSDVDLDDLYYMLIAYGMTIENAIGTYGVPSGTDVDGDGWVDLDDLYYVLRDYGT